MKALVIAMLLSVTAISHAEPVTVKAQKQIALSAEAVARMKMMSGGQELPKEAVEGMLTAQKNALFNKIVNDVRMAVYKLNQENYGGPLKDSLKKAESLGCNLDDLAYASYHFKDGDAVFKGDESLYMLLKVGDQVVGMLQNGEKQEWKPNH